MEGYRRLHKTERYQDARLQRCNECHRILREIGSLADSGFDPVMIKLIARELGVKLFAHLPFYVTGIQLEDGNHVQRSASDIQSVYELERKVWELWEVDRHVGKQAKKLRGKWEPVFLPPKSPDKK